MQNQRYGREDLAMFRKIIQDKLAKAREEYQNLEKAISDNTTSSSESGIIKVDDSAEVEERETLSQLATRQAKFIHNLERAEQRIDNGTYGVCCVTGRLIDKERLKVVPHTTHSVEAKNNRT